MLRQLRRVVTGHNAQGRSVVLSDELVGGYENPGWAGNGASVLWTSIGMPPDNTGPGVSGPLAVIPGPDGITFLISHFPPDSELTQMTPGQRKAALITDSESVPGQLKRDTRKDPRMHATHTLDYLVVLQGEMTMLLDEGEVVLKPFDTLIQRGTNHAWVNRGKEPVLMMAVVIGAKPMEP